MCCLGFGDRCTTEILATNDVSISVCRTRVARSLWKTVSHPSSTSSVKGNLRGQAWLTRVPCLVRLAYRGVADTRSGQMSLGVRGNGVKPWREVKTLRLEEPKWHFGRKLRSLRSPNNPTLESVYPSDDPAYVQRRVTKYRR